MLSDEFENACEHGGAAQLMVDSRMAVMNHQEEREKIWKKMRETDDSDDG